MKKVAVLFLGTGKRGVFFHTIEGEGAYMEKKTLPAVQCIYSKEGKKLPEILEETFRCYLFRVLAVSEPEASVNPHPR